MSAKLCSSKEVSYEIPPDQGSLDFVVVRIGSDRNGSSSMITKTHSMVNKL